MNSCFSNNAKKSFSQFNRMVRLKGSAQAKTTAKLRDIEWSSKWKNGKSEVQNLCGLKPVILKS
jgi:hypothetical protein